MEQLKQKGQDTFIDAKQLTISMKWTTAVDFDLAAAYQTKTGQRGLVYFAQLGQLENFPYLSLNKDEGVGEEGGENEEILQINQLDEMKAVWLFCWDYGMVQTGQSARFKDSDVRLTLSNAAGQQIAISIDTGEQGNVCYLAGLDNSGLRGTKLVNTSLAGTLKGLKTVDQLLALVRYQERHQ
jgi:tellurite resistance protein TerA